MKGKRNYRQTWIAFDMFECEFEVTESREKAKKIAEGYLEMYSDGATSEGWPSRFEDKVGYAKVIEANRKVDIEKREDYEEDQWPYGHWEGIHEYKLVPPEKIE